MKVVIYSPAFPPQIGGLEEIARICADGLTQLGHEITVLCDIPDESQTKYPFRVLRRAAFHEAFRASRASDVFLMFNMSLRGLALPLLTRKPLVICHQGWYGRDRNDHCWRSWLKMSLSRALAVNVACSRAVAGYLGGEVSVIPNAYNDGLFKMRPDISRSRDVLFVGRLVSDKGANLLVEAISRLAAQGLRPTVTITGEGPEERALRQQVASLGLDTQTIFTGALRGEELARTMNAHRILVVPSIWQEPFGIVALEGLASGAMVIGSCRGGLSEAIGLCGLTFENGSVIELTQVLEKALLMCDQPIGSDLALMSHLKLHQSISVVQAYESVLQQVINRQE